MNGIRCALLLGLISAAPAVAQMIGPAVTPAPPAIAPPGLSLPGAESSGPTMAPGITPPGAVATKASAGAPGSQVVRPKATAVVAGKTRSGQDPKEHHGPDPRGSPPRSADEPVAGFERSRATEGLA